MAERSSNFPRVKYDTALASNDDFEDETYLSPLEVESDATLPSRRRQCFVWIALLGCFALVLLSISLLVVEWGLPSFISLSTSNTYDLIVYRATPSGKA